MQRRDRLISVRVHRLAVVILVTVTLGRKDTEMSVVVVVACKARRLQLLNR